MSRSKKGAKGAGFEYWSRRPCTGDSPGKSTKKRTHKKERLQSKKLTDREMKDDKSRD